MCVFLACTSSSDIIAAALMMAIGEKAPLEPPSPTGPTGYLHSFSVRFMLLFY